MEGLDMLRPSSEDVTHNNHFNMSIVIGLLLVTLIIIIIIGVVMNLWAKQQNTQTGSWQRLSDENNRPISLMSVKSLAPPRAAYTLPTYRKSDTWSAYLKMIQSPGKLNDVVHSMKISTPNDSRKVSYENDSNRTFQQDLQQESKIKINNNYDDDSVLLDGKVNTYRYY